MKSNDEEVKTDNDKEEGHEPKEKKKIWVTKTMAESLGREELLKATLKEFIAYLVCLALITIYIFGQVSVNKYYLTNVMQNNFGNDEKLGDIKTVSDVWEYLEKNVIDNIFEEKEEGKTEGTTKPAQPDTTPAEQEIQELVVARENRVLGVPRIRQVKVRNDSCEIHGFFRRLFLSCYDRFSTDSEDTRPFGPGEYPAWVYTGPDETKSLAYWGIKTTYSGGGYFVDLTRNSKDAKKQIADLKDKLWIMRGTRAVFIDFSVYNANLNLFCINKVILEFLPSGGVTASARFLAVKLVYFGNSNDWFYRITLYMFAVFMVYYTTEELREMCYFGFQYFLQFWNYIDVSIILLTYTFVVIVEYLRYGVPKYINEIKEHPGQYGNMELIGYINSIGEIFAAVLLFLVYMKIFKFLNFNRRMAQLNDTLRNCVKDIAGFSVMFFIAFLAYAELGYLVFGSQLESFGGIGTAMFTLLRTILGDFDYTEIHKANWMVAPIYFLTYIMLVFFVLLNMFLAIINDTYEDVKTDIAIAPKEMEMTEYIKGLFYKVLKKLGCKVKAKTEEEKEFNATLDNIRDALAKCGFDDREIEMYFTRYEIDQVGEVAEEDINRFFEQFAKEEADRRSGKENYVKIKDFVKQDEKLEELENSIVHLADRVQELLRTVETLSTAQR